MMLFAAGARPRHLAVVMLAGVMLMPLLWSQMSREQRSRITALAQQTRAADKPGDDAYHLHQAKQMLALGGWQGSLLAGEATSDRTVYFVPEPHTDSIASVLGERLGLWGLLLMWRIGFIARGCSWDWSGADWRLPPPRANRSAGWWPSAFRPSLPCRC